MTHDDTCSPAALPAASLRTKVHKVSSISGSATVLVTVTVSV